jgi:phosphate starvation-inducible protein PhoH
MRKRSPAWMYCASDSGSLHVSPRLRPLYLRAVDILGADDHHKCAECLFEAIVDLIGISDLADMMHERVGRA